MAAAGARADLHVKVLDEGVVERAKRRDLDALVYAPHFTHLSTVRERAERFSDDDLLVVPARECFTGPWHDRKHVLAVDPGQPVPDFLGLADTVALLGEDRAAVLAPHPGFATVSLSRADVLEYRDAIDAVETYTPKFLPWHETRARAIAGAAGLPTFASSYAHLPRTVGDVWVTFDREVGTAADLRAALREGAPRRIGRREGAGHLATRAAEVGHLGWENSWLKFRRVVLGGMEQTHPRHPAYDGRFEEYSVY